MKSSNVFLLFLLVCIFIISTSTNATAAAHLFEITDGIAHTSGGFDGQGMGDIVITGRFKLIIDEPTGNAGFEDVSLSLQPFDFDWNLLEGSLNGTSLYLSCPCPLTPEDNYLEGTFQAGSVSLEGIIREPCYDCYQYDCSINAVEVTESCTLLTWDLTGDCFVDYEDLAEMRTQWLNGYDCNDLRMMASQWLSTDPCVPDDMVYIPDGEFEMGDHFAPEGYDDELPVHAVLLDAFFMSKYEITNQQYCDYLNDANSLALIKVDDGIVYAAGDTSNSFPYCNTSIYASGQINYSGGVFSVDIKDGITNMYNHPMVEVSWYGAVAYCNWRSGQEGYENCYDINDPNWPFDFSKHGYRLPTEAEWEYAARGGEHSPYYRYPWGDSIDGSMANYWSNGDPYETGSYPWTTLIGYYDGEQVPTGIDMANRYGLYDVAGNVMEWCNDWYDINYYDVSPYDNPEGPASGYWRVLRGGSWYGYDHYCRVAIRSSRYGSPDDRFYDVGFRIVLSD